MAIVKAHYTPNRTGQTKSSRYHVSQKAGLRVDYCSRDNTGRERGTWYSPDGRTSEHEVHEWAREQAHEHDYMYTLILSAEQEAKLTEHDFQEIMAKDSVFNDWRLIMHTNTANRHAHVITFTDKPLKREQFTQWREATRERIAEHEQEHQLVQGAQIYPGSAHRGLAVQQGVAHHQQQEQQQEMELEL